MFTTNDIVNLSNFNLSLKCFKIIWIIGYFLDDIVKSNRFCTFFIAFNLVILFIAFRDIFIGKLSKPDSNGKTIENININKLNFGNGISNMLMIILATSSIKLKRLSELFKDNDYDKLIMFTFHLLLNII